MIKILSKVAAFLTGDVGQKVVDGIRDYFPPSMSESERAHLEQAIKSQTHDQLVELRELVLAEQQAFRSAISNHEGTAKDLNQFGIFGKLIVFLRGCQRPIWGYMVLYMDVMWFSGKWSGLTQQQESAFWVINLLVLGFLFGERAVKNVMPVITEMMSQKVK